MYNYRDFPLPTCAGPFPFAAEVHRALSASFWRSTLTILSHDNRGRTLLDIACCTHPYVDFISSAQPVDRRPLRELPFIAMRVPWDVRRSLTLVNRQDRNTTLLGDC